ncbi:hypothetical protein [Deinococcus sp.]|uniref:hypothetical protein n=1 Tax=Deinococcus sp. TaxID=47478 RepID=UPI003C797635
MPTLTVIAGANGAGKSTFAAQNRLETIDADRITASYGLGFTAAANVKGARAALTQMHEHLQARRSFAIETTLATGQPVRLMERARGAGYQVNLAFIMPNAAEDTRLRIDNRVLAGGPNIADEDLRRREYRIRENLPSGIVNADTTALYLSSVVSQDFALEGAGRRRQGLEWRVVDNGERFSLPRLTQLQITPNIPEVVRRILGRYLPVEEVNTVSHSDEINRLFLT